MNHYRAYGLHIRTALDLPELTPIDPHSAVDIDVLCGVVDGPLPSSGPRLVQFGARSAYLAWPTIGKFRVEDRSTVIVDPLTDDPRRIRFALLGPVLAAVLQLRRFPLLHGSAVEANGKAIVFVGRKGAGKSTMAAASVAAGCGILNDDVLPFDSTADTMTLVPGFPALKLESAMHRDLLPALPVVGTPAQTAAEKLFVSDGSRSPSNLPIGAVVVLQPDALPRPVRLSPQTALQELLPNGYMLKFAEAALPNDQGPILFEACARLARECSVLRLGRSAHRSELPEIVSALMAECTGKSLTSALGRTEASHAWS